MSEFETQQLERAVDGLRFWWHEYEKYGVNLQDFEREHFTRVNAERGITSVYDSIGTEQKIQITAGEKALELFHFSSFHGFRDVAPALGGIVLPPGETMDVLHIYQNVRNWPSHGNLPALYLGGLFSTHTIQLAEALSEGGDLQIVPAALDETVQFDAMLERS